MVKRIARSLLAAPHVDVAEFAVLHEGGDLIVGDAEIRRRLIDRQQRGVAVGNDGVATLHRLDRLRILAAVEGAKVAANLPPQFVME